MKVNRKTASVSFVAVLVMLVCLPRLSIDIYLPSLPAMGIALNSAPETLQFTLSLYMVGYAISMLICGPFSDRYGRRPVMLAGVVVYLGATVVSTLATSVTTIIFARIFQALGGAAGTVVARVMVRDQFEKSEQIRVLTYLSTGMALSPVIAPIIGGAIETYVGWRGNFVAMAILGAFALAMVVFLLKETHHDVNKGATNVRNIISVYATLLRERSFMGYSLCISFAYGTYFAFITASPFLFQNAFGFSPLGYGAVFAAAVTGYIVGSTLLRKLSPRHEPDALMFWAVFANIGASVAMLGFVTIAPGATWGIIAPMVVIMITVGIIVPACQVAVLQPYPKVAATASGLFFFIQMISAALCGIVVGHLHHDTALPMTWSIVVSSVALVVSFFSLTWRPRKTSSGRVAQRRAA